MKSKALPFASLSNRETMILMMLLEGKAIKTISEDLGIEPKMTNTYCYRIMEKLNLRNWIPNMDDIRSILEIMASSKPKQNSKPTVLVKTSVQPDQKSQRLDPFLIKEYPHYSHDPYGFLYEQYWQLVFGTGL